MDGLYSTILLKWMITRGTPILGNLQYMLMVVIEIFWDIDGYVDIQYHSVFMSVSYSTFQFNLSWYFEILYVNIIQYPLSLHVVVEI